MTKIGWVSDFYSYCHEKKFVSFDLFDTLIKRRLLKVNEVHDTVSAYALALVSRRHEESPHDLTLVRYRISDALKSFDGTGTQEPLIDDVWQEILVRYVPDAIQRQKLVRKIVDFELAIEMVNLDVVDGAIDLLANLRSAGKVIIAISDMYFDMPSMKAILGKIGLLEYFDYIYVSSDSKLTKQSGDLFKSVISDMNIAYNEIIHVGDNEHSDILMAKAVGIDCIFVSQEQYLELDRPKFGDRTRIEEEVADLNKLHLLSILFDSTSKRFDHLYFLARDGCALNEQLQVWQNPLIEQFLKPPVFSDLYLNRALTCWGSIDFSENWLIEAIGLVFWLNGGEASPEEFCRQFAIDNVPAALGTTMLRSDTDTFRLAEIFREAGLQPAIKSAVNEKRNFIVRHLQDIGFFDQKVIGLSDVGYSGTVVRDLNTLFLSLSGKEQRITPPQMHLHLIATNPNYDRNASKAFPYARFSPQVVLPHNLVRDDLKASFAWLEYFYKHPTLKPILRFVEIDGQVMPELRHDAPSEKYTPAQRVAQFAIARDEDIILLWLAAVNFHGPLADPILRRFEAPDADTLAQMSDEVFEAHSIQGSKRSILLVVEGGRPEAIAKAAIDGDYWVQGSIAASAATSELNNAASATTVSSRTKKKRKFLDIFGLGQNAPASLNTAAKSFDPHFYRNFYPDLRIFSSDQELWQHYCTHGRKEGRLVNFGALTVQLTAECGRIPADFNPHTYLNLNPDLAHALDAPERALDHYMRVGRLEGRQYRQALRDLTREFDNLIAAGTVKLTDRERAARRQGQSALSLILARHGLREGPWIDEISVAEFRALHASWAGPVMNKADCILAIAEHGMEKTPALSLKCNFDPAFYARQIPEFHDLDPSGLYGHYLSEGALQGLAPSEPSALDRLWGYSDFPQNFDWEGFAASAGLQATAIDRVDVLRKFLLSADPSRVKFVRPSTDGRLFIFLASRAWFYQGRPEDAVEILTVGLEVCGPRSDFHHRLGDLHRHMGKHELALRHFRSAITLGTPDRWSYINAASMLTEKGDHASALKILEQGRVVWQERAPWRNAQSDAMRVKCRALLNEAVSSGLGQTELGAVDRFMKSIRVEASRATAFDKGNGVLVLTGRAASSERRDRKLSDAVSVFDLHSIEKSDYLAAMLRHDTVIFHELPFTFDVLYAIACAHALGKQTFAWVGDLADWRSHQLRHFEWDWAGVDASPLSQSMFLETLLVARCCGYAVTTLAGFVDGLERVLPEPKVEHVTGSAQRPLALDTARRFVLVTPGQNLSADDVQNIAKALRDAAEADARLHFLLERRIAETDTISRISHRWETLSAGVSLPLLAQTAAMCDLVIQFVEDPDRQFSMSSEAATFGIPALLVRLSSPNASSNRKYAADRSDGKQNLAVSGALAAISDMPSLIASALQAGSVEVVDVSAMHRGQLLSEHSSSLPEPRPERKKIMFANVFFAPQVIGGATRVLMDNLDYCLDNHHNDYDFAAFCADEQNDNAGSWRLDNYRGIPVFRIATPQELNMDWRASNEMVAARFLIALEAFKPDLVHIHCLQRLGVAVAEVCRERNIPYFVTLHDAWWISDYPFLTDETGNPVEVEADTRLQARLPGVGCETSLLRGERLRTALLGATKRFAVSARFAEVYRQAGIECSVVENGSSRITPQPRSGSRDGRINLCHVGGLEYHKGAYLIEAALRMNSFTNLNFTIVDLARGPGEETRTVWGTTPVTITGKMSTAEIARFYASMDVLVAPSTWPESFGLVTREALSHGLWVIASDRGAMGDPVEPDINGFVVSVDDATHLASVFAKIDQEPARFGSSPPALKGLRLVDEQSKEIEQIYRRFFEAIQVQP